MLTTAELSLVSAVVFFLLHLVVVAKQLDVVVLWSSGAVLDWLLIHCSHNPLQTTLSKLLTVLRPTQPPVLCRTGDEYGHHGVKASSNPQ